MKQFLRLTPAPGALLLAGIALLGKAGFAQSFFLGFEENGNFICGESGPTEATIHCTLSGSQGFSGAEGWAIGLKSSGHRFLDLTVSGTAAEAALSGGFVFNELTRGEGNEGAVSLVALSFGKALALPAGAVNRILTLKVEGSLGDQVQLEFVDGLQSSAGTVSNIVHVGARGFVPAQAPPQQFTISSSPHLGFSMKNVYSSSPYEEIAGGRAANGVVEVLSPPGGQSAAHVFHCFIPEEGNNRGGIQGWVLGVGLDGDAEITSATTQGTATERQLRGGSGFSKTELVDPTRNHGQRGVISAIVLSFLEPVTLPEVGTYAVLDLGLEADLSRCDGDCTGLLSLKDGLLGSGQPIHNMMTISGNSVRPCNVDTASITVRFIAAKESFLSGNADGDDRVDLADVLFIFAQLFTGGPIGGCRSAEDGNGDGRVDISDPIFLFQFLFRGGRPPPPPFPACSPVLEDDPGRLGCLEPHALCL